MDNRVTITGLLTRRDFIRTAGVGAAGLMGAGFLAACGREDRATEGAAGVSTRLNWIRNVEYAGWWFADREGFFDQEQINALVIPGGPNAPASVTVVTGGQVDVGVQASLRQVMQGIIEGADLVIFATIYQRSILGIMSLPENPIHTAQDMIGKRIGTPTFSRPNIDAIFKVNNLPLDYTFVPVGFDASALTNHEVDGLEVFVSDQPLYLQSQGIEHVIVTYADLGYALYANVLFSRRDFIEENGDALARYMRAVIKGWEMNDKQPDEGARLAVEVYGADLGLDINQQREANTVQIPFLHSPLTDQTGLMRISPEDLGGSMYRALEASGVTGLPDVEKVTDTSVLDQAFGDKNKLLGS